MALSSLTKNINKIVEEPINEDGVCIFSDIECKDYDQICNKFFPTLYETLFGEKTPSLSPTGQAMAKELGDWYMTLTGVYIRIAGSTKPPHWLPHFVPDSLLLQEIAYQTFINDRKIQIGQRASQHTFLL